MDILTALPTVLSAAVVADWLEIEGLARLDSAYSVKSERDGLLALLKQSDTVYTVPDEAYDRDETAEVVKYITKRGLKVSNVKFTREVDVDTFMAFMEVTGNSLTSIHFVEVPTCVETERLMKEVIIRSRGLTELSFYECPMTPLTWTFFALFPLLEKVSLCSNRPLALPVNGMDLGQCPCLRFVSMAGSGITSDAAVALAELAPADNIHLLSIVNTLLVSDHAIVHIARRCPNLRALALTNMPRMSNAVVTYVAELCPHIQHLDVSYNSLNDESFVPVVQGLKLQTLCIDDNILLTDETLGSIETHQAATLGTLFIANIPDFSAHRIMRLLWRCKQLHTLSVGGDEDVEELFTEGFVLCLANVETLLLFGDEIRSHNLGHIARHCARLKHLGVITKRSVKKGLLEVVQKCHALEVLRVQKTDPRCLLQWKKLNPALAVRKIEGDYHYFDIQSVEM